MNNNLVEIKSATAKVTRAPVPDPGSDHTYVNPQLLAILPTYRCTAACKHCCFDSNPSFEQHGTCNELSNIIDMIERVSKYDSMRLVSFTGGECFLLGNDLNEAIAFAESKGLKTRCVTNGFWAKSYKAGKKRLQGLVDAGLKELSISTGDEHAKYVTLDTVINATVIALELGVHTDVVVEIVKDRTITVDDVLSHPKLLALPEDTRKNCNVLESPWMPMSYEVVLDQPAKLLANRDNVGSFEGCDSILTTVALTPFNRIGLCCGLSREHIPELTVDNGDLETILKEAGNDFVKIWLSVDGPEKILAWAAEKDPTIDWENKYAHRCHACLALHKDPKVGAVIREHYKERIGDVLLRHNMHLQRQVINAPGVHEGRA